ARDHFEREPLVWPVRRLEEHDLREIAEVRIARIQAACLDPVAAEGDLRLIAEGKAGAEGGAEKDPAVADVVEHGLDAEVEVLVVAALAEQVATPSPADQDAVRDAPAVPLAGGRLPPRPVLAVEQRHEAVVGVWRTPRTAQVGEVQVLERDLHRGAGVQL